MEDIGVPIDDDGEDENFVPSCRVAASPSEELPLELEFGKEPVRERVLRSDLRSAHEPFLIRPGSTNVEESEDEGCWVSFSDTGKLDSFALIIVWNVGDSADGCVTK